MRIETLLVESERLKLSLKLNGRAERCEIAPSDLGFSYPTTELSQLLFRSFGLIFLIAPHLPKRIIFRFPVIRPIRSILAAMYHSEGLPAPEILGPQITDELTPSSHLTILKRGAVICFSGGNDSLWNAMWAKEKFGDKNVVAVHVTGLCRLVGSEERRYTQEQIRKIGLRVHFVRLINGTRNIGGIDMRARDLLLMALLIPIAYQYGLNTIITEGYANCRRSPLFSERKSTMESMNAIFAQMKLGVSVRWRNRKTIAVLRDLYCRFPDLVPLTCSCETTPGLKVIFKRRWKLLHPSFILYPSQCGFCGKCRNINLARILFDDTVRTFKLSDIRKVAYAALMSSQPLFGSHPAQIASSLRLSFLGHTRDLQNHISGSMDRCG